MAAPVGRRARTVLAALTGALLLATVIGVAVLWPGPDARVDSAEFLAPGVEIVPATVTSTSPAASAEEIAVIEAVGRAAPLEDQTLSVEVPPEVASGGIHEGDRIRVLSVGDPSGESGEVFTATMRIGRDHIASTVYTLAYAYIGSALPLLMYASTINRSLMDTLTSGEIAAEIFRTLIASIGLVLAIPLTTAIAAALATRPTQEQGRSRRRQLEERLARF